MNTPTVLVFAGGTSAEREVSLGSGIACAKALSRSFPTRFVKIDSNALPDGIDPRAHVVFSTLHGTFGEDGGMQALLEEAGVAYAGCDAKTSALTMDKAKTKERAAARGIRVAEAVLFPASAVPTAASISERLGNQVVLKPNDEGSSVGLSLTQTTAELQVALGKITRGQWLAEKRIVGRELSVGVLGGKAMGVVEIRPHSGVFDYTSKYTKGLTDYLAPAPLDPSVTASVRLAAENAYAACGCRDFARVDFILSGDSEPFLLEINTLPGMKETSLLPMSARCEGRDFIALVREMVMPAFARGHVEQAPLSP